MRLRWSIVLVLAASSSSASIVRSLSDAVVQALKVQDMATIAFFSHPGKGLRFAPYPFFSVGDRKFGAAQVAALPTSSTSYLWGHYDGSGDPVQGTFAQYYPQFIWKHDFTSAGIVVGENVRIRTAHHSTNWASTYPGRAFVEYHYPGTAPASNFDWWSLVLVWQRHGGVWRLVCITNDMQGV